jgi:hypothetical protein
MPSSLFSRFFISGSSAPNTSHLLLLSTFACASLYYLLKRSRYNAVQLQYKRLTSKRPRLSPADMIAVLTEVLEGTAIIVEEVGNAVSIGGDHTNGDENERLAVEAAARADVQSQLQALELKLLSARGLSASGEDFENALTYYTQIEKTAEVMMLSQRVKRLAGRYFLTQAKVLDVMRGSFEVQARVSLQFVEQLVRSGRASSMMDLQRAMGGPAMEKRLNDELVEFSLNETGMTVLEIDAVTNKPSWRNDQAFLAALARVTNEGQEILNQAQQRMAMMVQGGGFEE